MALPSVPSSKQKTVGSLLTSAEVNQLLNLDSRVIFSEGMSIYRKPTGIIIPFYIYPSSIYTNTDYNNLIELKKKYHDVPLIVVLNPSSGPGSVADGNYTAAIQRLRGAGITVIGYVSTNYTVNSIASVKSDIDDWVTLYPDIQGIFFDEMTNDADDTHVDYYAELTVYCHYDKNLYPTVGNPGANQLERYFTTLTSDIILIHENSTIPTIADIKGDFDGGHSDFEYMKRGAILYNQSDLPWTSADVSAGEAYMEELRKYLGWLYFTDDNLPNPYDTYSGLLEKTFAYLSSVKPEALYIDESGNIGINQMEPTVFIEAKKDQDSETRLHLVNNNTGTSSRTVISGRSDGVSIDLYSFSTGYTTSNEFEQDSALLRANAGNLNIAASSTNSIKFWNNSTQRMIIDSSGALLVNENTIASSSLFKVTSTGNAVPTAILRNETGNTEFQLALHSATQLDSGSAEGFLLGISNSSAPSSGYHEPNGAKIVNTLAGPMIFATNNTERMRIDSSGNVGIGETSPAGKLHIRTDTDDNLIIRNDSGKDGPHIGASKDNGSNQQLTFGPGNQVTMTIDTANRIGIGTTTPSTKLHVKDGDILLDNGWFATGGETSPDVDDGGICLNTKATDGFVLTFKNSDVAHGITSIMQTDTYTAFQKASDLSGGLKINSASEGTEALYLRSIGTTEDTTDASTSVGTTYITSSLKSGTTETSLGTTANIFTVANLTDARFLIKGNGDLHATNTTISALDDHDDIQLARNLQLATAKKHKHLVPQEEFKKLCELGALSSNGEFQISQGMHSVSLGAISQLFNGLVNLCREKFDMSQEDVIKLTRKYVN